MAFATMQPQRGEIIALCAHALTDPPQHWLKVGRGAGIHVGTGAPSHYDWVCCCTACWVTFAATGRFELVQFTPWDEWDDPDSPIVEIPERH